MHDVICKYWPWANKTTFPDTINGNDITPCLPVMHAKAHTWHCQVSMHAMYTIIRIVQYCKFYTKGALGSPLARWSWCRIWGGHGTVFQLYF